VSRTVSAHPAAQDRREPDEDGGLLALGEEPGHRQFAGCAVALEHAVCAGAAGVDNALGDAFMVEVRDLLA